MLVTPDGVLIDAVPLPPLEGGHPGAAVSPGGPGPHEPRGDRDLAVVVAHGFTMTWQRPLGWPLGGQLVRWFNRSGGVITFAFRGHGRSGGLTTIGDKEIDDLDVAVRYAR